MARIEVLQISKKCWNSDLVKLLGSNKLRQRPGNKITRKRWYWEVTGSICKNYILCNVLEFNCTDFLQSPQVVHQTAVHFTSALISPKLHAKVGMIITGKIEHGSWRVRTGWQHTGKKIAVFTFHNIWMSDMVKNHVYWLKPSGYSFSSLLPPANDDWDKVMFLRLSVSHSLHREREGTGAICMMSLPVWLLVLCSFWGCLCLWCHVPSGVSVSGPMFLPWGSVSRSLPSFSFICWSWCTVANVTRQGCKTFKSHCCIQSWIGGRSWNPAKSFR